MKHVDLRWTWVLESPLHVGSGLSRPGHADRLIGRDGNDRPVIPGDAVKGALRMSAEQVLAWLGAAQRYDGEGATAEPTHPLLVALFGGGGVHHFHPARPRDASTEGAPRSMRMASTAIDGATGTAMGETLRTVEVLAAGARFDARVEVWLGDVDESVVTLLAASLLATEVVGGRAAAGWGRVRAEALHVAIDGTPWGDAAALVDEARVSALVDALRGKAAPTLAPRGRPLGRPSSASPAVWHRIIIELQEPTTLSAAPQVSNQVDTLDHIPATALRGALAAMWRRRGYDDGSILAALAPSTRWSAASPLDEAGVACVPVPRSFFRAKGESGFGAGGHGVYDALCGARAPSADSHQEKTPIQWRAIGGGWMTAADAPAEHKIARQTAMHVARDYGTGSKRHGALYARESIVTRGEVGPRFVAWVKGPMPPVAEGDVLEVGQRRSAGNGRAVIVAVSSGAAPERLRAAPVAPRVVCVHLLSPLLARGVNGAWLSSLDGAAWARLLGVDAGALPRCTAKVAARALKGWNVRWGHARAAVTALDAGSVFRFDCVDEAVAEAWRAALSQREPEGIGERRHEGFGRFAVDPPWLGRLRGTTLTTLPPRVAPTASMEAQAWPGCESIPAPRLDEIALVARRAAESLPDGAERVIQELARLMTLPHAARGDVFARCDLMTRAAGQAGADDARRGRRPAWAAFASGARARAFLEALSGDDELRFGLEALLLASPRRGP